MKNFFLSKINWLGILTILMGLQDFIGTWDFSQMTIKSWVLFVIGAAIVIFRTFGANKPISGTGKTA